MNGTSEAGLGARYETALVRLVVWAVGRPTAGVGVLVGSRQVVTCSHVVNTALGRPQREQVKPESSAMVEVEFPLLPDSPVRRAKVEAWVPPPVGGMGGGDVAGLILNEDGPVGAHRARFASALPPPGGALRVFGYPRVPPQAGGAWVDVELKGEISGQLIQVEARTDQTVKAQPGYSGSPVWQHATGEIVGILQATRFAEEPERDAYLLPAALVAPAWEEQFDYLLVPPNPYRGLEPFTTSHEHFFFGRDRDIESLSNRVEAHPVVVLVGRSGVGKSSLVQAGLVPRLRKRGNWTEVIVRPGQDPWHRLAAGLLRAQYGMEMTKKREEIERTIRQLKDEGLAPIARFLRSIDHPLLLVIDQFEELLATGDLPDRQLLDLLFANRETTEGAARVVITLRADYLDLLLAVPGIGRDLDQRIYPLSPLTAEELEKAVGCPARVHAVDFEPGLIDRLIWDTGTGSLPLLQFTLTRLWSTQRLKTLRFVGYHALGGVSGAIERFAEQQMAKLSDHTAEVINKVLLHLVRVPVDDATRATRRRAYETDLPTEGWEILRRLADASLVVTDRDRDGPYAELAHEALIESWARLRDLVRNNTEFLKWLAWMHRRATDADPLPAARIAEARRWVETRPGEIPDTIKSFINSSTIAIETRLRELTIAVDLQHQLVSPLRAATSRAEEVLASQRFDLRAERQLNAIRGLCRKASRVAMSANVIAMLSKGEAPVPKPELVGVDDLLHTLSAFAGDAQVLSDPHAGMSFEVDRDSFRALRRRRVRVDSFFLQQCIGNVLDNAAKYGYQETVVQIGASVSGGVLALCTTSIGLPLDPDEVQRCLERGWRGMSARSTTGEGSGLGLWIADNLMRAMDGRVVVRAEADQTTVCLELPVP